MTAEVHGSRLDSLEWVSTHDTPENELSEMLITLTSNIGPAHASCCPMWNADCIISIVMTQRHIEAVAA